MAETASTQSRGRKGQDRDAILGRGTRRTLIQIKPATLSFICRLAPSLVCQILPESKAMFDSTYPKLRGNTSQEGLTQTKGTIDARILPNLKIVSA
jgi:hypothetical protein